VAASPAITTDDQNASRPGSFGEGASVILDCIACYFWTFAKRYRANDAAEVNMGKRMQQSRLQHLRILSGCLEAM
jgi:hypothetical protein